MGVAKSYSDRLHGEIGAYAAWLPMANHFTLGDYGLISQDIFQRLGNISEFGVSLPQGENSSPIELDFRSDGTSIVSLVGDATVDALPDAPIEAKLKIEFRDEDSYYVKAARTSVQEVSNLREIALRLGNAPGWRRKYRVVWGTVTGHDCVIATSTSANATLVLSGRADALKQVGLGAIGANVQVTAENNVGIRIVGKTGVVGLKLFKLRTFSADAKFLDDDDTPEDRLVDRGPAVEDDV